MTRKQRRSSGLGSGRPVLLEEGNTSWQERCRRKGGGIRNRIALTRMRAEGRRQERQGVKIRALRERLIKGCKLTGANDVAWLPRNFGPERPKPTTGVTCGSRSLPEVQRTSRSPIRVSFACIVLIICMLLVASSSRNGIRCFKHRIHKEAQIYLNAKERGRRKTDRMVVVSRFIVHHAMYDCAFVSRRTILDSILLFCFTHNAKVIEHIIHLYLDIYYMPDT